MKNICIHPNIIHYFCGTMYQVDDWDEYDWDEYEEPNIAEQINKTKVEHTVEEAKKIIKDAIFRAEREYDSVIEDNKEWLSAIKKDIADLEVTKETLKDGICDITIKHKESENKLSELTARNSVLKTDVKMLIEERNILTLEKDKIVQNMKDDAEQKALNEYQELFINLNKMREEHKELKTELEKYNGIFYKKEKDVDLDEELNTLQYKKIAVWQYEESSGVFYDCSNTHILEIKHQEYQADTNNAVIKFQVLGHAHSVNFEFMIQTNTSTGKVRHLQRNLKNIANIDALRSFSLKWFKQNPSCLTHAEKEELQSRKIEYLKSEVTEDSIIFKTITDWFGSSGVTVYKLFQVTVPHQQEGYIVCNRWINEEELLVHGTNPNNLEGVYKHGLKQIYSGKGLLGHGLYFTDEAKYSTASHYGPKDKDGYHKLLLFRVATGSSYHTTNAMVNQKVVPDDHHSITAMTNGNTVTVTGTKIWAIYDEKQVMPIAEVWCK